MAVVSHGTSLTEHELLEQIQNHWEQEMLARLDKILTKMSPWDLVLLFGTERDWKFVYDKHKLDREQRAVLDEFLEDCSQICA